MRRCSVLQIRHFNLHFVCAAAPQQGERHRLSDSDLLKTFSKVRQPTHRAIIDPRDHIAETAGLLVDAFQSCPLGRRTRHDARDDNTCNAELGGRRLVGCNDPDARIGYPPLIDQLRNDAVHPVNGDGEANAGVGAGGRENGRVDSDEST
jgi:hypothetical protein